jgi:hypothetical protein
MEAAWSSETSVSRRHNPDIAMKASTLTEAVPPVSARLRSCRRDFYYDELRSAVFVAAAAPTCTKSRIGGMGPHFRVSGTRASWN